MQHTNTHATHTNARVNTSMNVQETYEHGASSLDARHAAGMQLEAKYHSCNSTHLMVSPSTVSGKAADRPHGTQSCAAF